MHAFLQKTAWTMTVPRPYSCFHLLFCGVGIILVGFLVHILCKKCYKIPYVPFYGCGLVLALGELYKQLFLYQIVNQGRYDWWYFPMQLCSTPMYLCIILIFMHKKQSYHPHHLHLSPGFFPSGRHHGTGRTIRTNAALRDTDRSRTDLAPDPDLYRSLLPPVRSCRKKLAGIRKNTAIAGSVSRIRFYY